MASCFLARHVYASVNEDGAVLLDLRADRYLGLDRVQSAVLGQCVEDWPCRGGTGDADPREAEAFTKALLEQGILTTREHCGRSAAPPRVPRVEAQLYEWDSTEPRNISAADVGAFIVAFTGAMTTLHGQPLEQIVRRVEQRKRTSACEAPDSSALRDLTGTFRALRPFFYSARERCVLDSLVLLEFLAKRNLYPVWVIGVKANPFSAHSWVQTEHYVLNGAAGYVRAFAPILVV
jgi:hypothetical protein